MENDPNNPSPAEPNPAEAPTQPGSAPTQPVLKYLAASDVLRNVRTYTYLIAGFLIPLLLLTYILSSQAQWYAVKRLEELTAGRCFANKQTPTPQRQWYRIGLKPDFPILEGKLQFSSEISPQPTQNARDRIQCQFEELLNRTQHHGAGLSKLFGFYTSSVIMSGLTSAVAAIVLLFITSSGWNHAHNYAKAIFLVSVATSGYYVAFPKLFLLEENIAANREHFLQYIALTDEVCSYAATGQGYVLKASVTAAAPPNTPAAPQKTANSVGQNSPHTTGSVEEFVRMRHADPAAFIAYMDSELRHWNTIAVGFDTSKNPDFKKLFDEGLKSR